MPRCRRYIARTKPTTDTVDLEALCQKIEPPSRHDIVDIDRLSWPIRNRDGLLAALRRRSSDRRGRSAARSSTTSRQESPSAREFPAARSSRMSRPGPASPGRTSRWSRPSCLSIRTSCILEAIDDGRLDRLIDRFTTVAGSTIPPAHPRTKVIASEPRHELALVWRWHAPAGLSEEENDRLNREQLAYIISEVWPKTPHPSLRRRTPLQAGQAGDSETFLRGSIRRMEALTTRRRRCSTGTSCARSFT